MSNTEAYRRNFELPFIRLQHLLRCHGKPETRKGRWRIYALVDPTDETIRYVGATRHPELRLRKHCETREGHKGAWIQRLSNKGLKPRMVFLARSSNHLWEQDEIAWIEFARAHGRVYNWHLGGVPGRSTRNQTRDPRRAKEAKKAFFARRREAAHANLARVQAGVTSKAQEWRG